MDSGARENTERAHGKIQRKFNEIMILLLTLERYERGKAEISVRSSAKRSSSSHSTRYPRHIDWLAAIPIFSYNSVGWISGHPRSWPREIWLRLQSIRHLGFDILKVFRPWYIPRLFFEVPRCEKLWRTFIDISSRKIMHDLACQWHFNRSATSRPESSSYGAPTIKHICFCYVCSLLSGRLDWFHHSEAPAVLNANCPSSLSELLVSFD